MPLLGLSTAKTSNITGSMIVKVGIKNISSPLLYLILLSLMSRSKLLRDNPHEDRRMNRSLNIGLDGFQRRSMVVKSHLHSDLNI